MKTNLFQIKTNRFHKLGLLASVIALSSPAWAVDPDPTQIYSTLTVPFNAGLTIIIGFTAVLMVIKWIKRAVNR